MLAPRSTVILIHGRAAYCLRLTSSVVAPAKSPADSALTMPTPSANHETFFMSVLVGTLIFPMRTVICMEDRLDLERAELPGRDRDLLLADDLVRDLNRPRALARRLALLP